MARRRANGEGHICKTKSGRWEGMLTIGYKPDGKQKFKYFSAKTQQEVIKKLNAYKNERNKGVIVEPTKLTVAQWLDNWYEIHVVNKVKITTRVSYESDIVHHLKPHLGHIRLNELKLHQVQKIYNEFLKSGRVDGKGGLSPKSIKNIHVVLHCALEQAVKEDLLIKNPLNGITLPRRTQKQIEVLTPEEQKKLVNCCLEHRWDTIILLTLYSGMRLGEVLGLTWKDINFEKNSIRINKQLSRLRDYNGSTFRTKLDLRAETKTSSSNRTIYIAPVIMEKLKEHKERQDKHRKSLGKAYNNLNMVFAREDGNYVDPGTFRDHYKNTLTKAGIGHKTFHSLRHTFATRALESGANIKVVSEILGHAGVQITLDTYSHVSPELQQEAMQRIADIFF